MKAGWQRTTLGSAFVTVTGNTPPKNNADFYGQFMPLVKPPELCDAMLDSAEDGLSETGAEVARTVPANSILVSCIGNLGKIGLNTVPVAFNQQINAILPNNGKAIPEFMFYQVLTSSFREQLEALASGTTVPIVNKSKFNSIEIVLAPLPEQQRIVGILDQAFDGIATAKANFETNLQNARALFESHLQSIFTQRGEGWVGMKLGEICEVKDGTHDSPKYVADGIPFVTQKNVREDGLSFANTKFISNEDHAKFYKRSNVAHGDILISMIGANRGMACLVDDERVFSIKNVGLVKANNAINPRFLLHFLKSSQASEYVSSRSKGGAQEFIGLTELRQFPIVVPELARQVMLAAKLDELSGEIQRLESLYQRKLAALDALKQSLLHQAFSGTL
jgi:type I restriction enzyme S subunit